MNIAVVTGASSGLGREFAIQINEKYSENTDEIWLIARREDRLLSLAKEIESMGKCKARIFPMDITDKNSVENFSQTLKEQNANIIFLVNAAGMGKIGNTAEISREDSLKMIDLNCAAAVNMTLICLEHMSAGARILQICSTAAFQPMQGLNIYSASKAFLLRFSMALRWELSGRKIKLTAICPYWIKDTEFISVAQNGDKEKSKKSVKHFALASKTKSVVKFSLKANNIGMWYFTPGFVCFFHSIFARILPSIASMGIWEVLRKL